MNHSYLDADFEFIPSDKLASHSMPDHLHRVELNLCASIRYSEMTQNTLPPSHKFMYEFGCFTAFWSNFELMMEVGIWLHSDRPAKENCKLINPKTAGKKRATLRDTFLMKKMTEAHDALEEVFRVADRNGWIHGHVLNPNGDFSRLTRLRVELDGADLKVDNTIINFDTSPFASFYEAFGEFEAKSGISKQQCNEYIVLLQAA